MSAERSSPSIRSEEILTGSNQSSEYVAPMICCPISSATFAYQQLAQTSMFRLFSTSMNFTAMEASLDK